MNKLMTDEELEKQIRDITKTMLIALSEWQAGAPVDYYTAKQKGRRELFDLVQSQKQAHADMVIGEDEEIDMLLDADWCLIETSRQMNGAKPYHFKHARNIFRATQREKNKV